MDAAPSPAPPQPPPTSVAWPRPAQLAAALLLGGALALFGVHVWGYSGWGNRPTDLATGRSPAYRIDLNRAGHAELLQLPGVGPQLAERIETYRRENGRFHSIDDLRHVHGIGPATLARLRTWVCIEEAEDQPPRSAPVKTVQTSTKPPAAPPGGKKSPETTEPIDINTASAAELRKLPGIGPKLSQAIVDERVKASFKSVDDLRRVHGIGAKTLDRLRPYVTVDAGTQRATAGE
jgi:competence protein ComEA